MNDTNELLDEKEVYYLCIGSIIGIGFFKLSHDIVKVAGQDGWLPNIIGIIYPSYVILISLYIMKRFPNENIISIGKKYFGKGLGTILGILYIMEFAMLLPSIAAGFTNVLRVYAVTFLPRINMTVCILGGAWYCSMIGIKNISRMSKLTFYIFLLPITVSIGALKNGSILNLQPVFQCSGKQLLSATFLTTFQYSGMEFLLLIHPYFKNKDKVGKSIFGALFIMTIIYTWIVFISIYYLGPDLVPKSLWPFTLVTESIIVPVINNFRFIFVFLWAIVIIKTVSNHYYYMVMGIVSNFNISQNKVAAWIFPILILISSFYKNEVIRRYIGNAIINSTVVFNVMYITLIAIIIHFKEKKVQIKNKQV